MTQPIWSCVAENVPCMCGSATAAMVQSTEYRKLASPTEAVIRAGCFDEITMSAAVARDRGRRGKETRQPAVVDHLLHDSRQAARPAGIDRNGDGHAGAQLRIARRLLDLDSHRAAVPDLYPVPG